jgi:hypothetical protein
MSRPQYIRAIGSSFGVALGGHPTEVAPADLELLQESRPYHLGWLLYARQLMRSLEGTEARSAAESRG